MVARDLGIEGYLHEINSITSSRVFGSHIMLVESQRHGPACIKLWSISEDHSPPFTEWQSHSLPKQRGIVQLYTSPKRLRNAFFLKLRCQMLVTDDIKLPINAAKCYSLQFRIYSDLLCPSQFRSYTTSLPHPSVLGSFSLWQRVLRHHPQEPASAGTSPPRQKPLL